MGMDIEVTSGAIATLLEEAKRAAPAECCGLLLGRDGKVQEARPASNGYYHSHPNGHPLPSASDCQHASGDNRCWAIIGEGSVRFFRDSPAGFLPIAVQQAE
jgi:proteasome lid subunit RPN8/RPN11